MKYMKLILLILIFCLFGGLQESEAQVDTLSVDIYGYGAVQSVGYDCPFQETGGSLKVEGNVGLEYRCNVWPIDAEGDSTPGVVRYEVVDTTFLQATIEADGTLVYTILRKGNARLKLWPEPQLLLALYYPGKHQLGMEEWVDTIMPLAWQPFGDAEGNIVGSVATIPCAYLDVGEGYAGSTAKGSEAGVECPDLGGESLPSFAVEWMFGDGKFTTDENGWIQIVNPVRITEPLVLMAKAGM